MRFYFHSKNYEDAPDLTKRSEKIGLWTSTVMSFAYAAAIGVLLYLITGILDVIVVAAVLIFVMPIVMGIVRKSLFKKLDKEYASRKTVRPEVSQQPVVQETQKTVAPQKKTVNMVFQRNPAECGTACLCMILDYYGKAASLNQLGEECGVMEKGSNAAEMMRAAKRRGLNCRGFRTDAEQLRGTNAPAIIHWRNCHFVVLEKVQGDNVYLCDPAIGKIATNFDALRQNYSGVLLTFEELA